jgi:CO/xanthine dehydrogenase Mo-binding subunit
MNRTMLDYKLQTAADAPIVNVAWIEIPAADGGPRGSKGVAEAPNVATAAAIGNAIAKIAGRRVMQLPMSAERVWSVINS